MKNKADTKARIALAAEQELRKTRPELFACEPILEIPERLDHAITFSALRRDDKEAASEMICSQSKFNPTRGFIYFISCHDMVKIGVATDVHLRLSGLQTGCPYPLVLLGSVATIKAFEDEMLLHDLLSKYHVRGEWFKIPEKIMRRLLLGRWG